jgi:hypothetical protein
LPARHFNKRCRRLFEIPAEILSAVRPGLLSAVTTDPSALQAGLLPVFACVRVYLYVAMTDRIGNPEGGVF